MRFSICVATCLLLGLASCAEKPLPVDQKSGGKRPSTPPKKLPPKTSQVKKSTAKKSPPDDGSPRYLSRRDFESGWIKLFDDRTLFGWKANSDAKWTINDGVISANSGTAGLLLTTVPFADYEFTCDYRLAKGGNSGIFLRTIFDPKDPARDCYELNMCDSHASHPTGSLVARKKAAVTVVGEGAWKRYFVTVQGRRIVAKLDGRIVIDFTDNTENFRPSGLIGLQYREGKIEFRDVHLRPLGFESNIGEKNLSGWKTIPGAKGEISNEGGTIHMKGGPAFLQSDRKWGDFVLHAQVRTNAQRVNSGIFFRSIAGTEKQPSNGYELQIHNGFKNGDRAQPDDYKTGYGTGSIFRFAKVRWVVPNDNEWCSITLVAAGNHFATWVNGHQVTDWTDARQPNENPRRGRRDAAGHLILQAHDSTTDVSFRKLWVVTTPTAGEKAKNAKP